MPENYRKPPQQTAIDVQSIKSTIEQVLGRSIEGLTVVREIDGTPVDVHHIHLVAGDSLTTAEKDDLEKNLGWRPEAVGGG